MAAGIQMMVLIAGLAASSASLADPPPLTDVAFETAFKCPEAMADDARRRQALVDYFHWVQARHPDWSIANAVEFKKTLLVRHQCAASLRDLADYAKREDKVAPSR